jgi:hypothetical protein
MSRVAGSCPRLGVDPLIAQLPAAGSNLTARLHNVEKECSQSLCTSVITIASVFPRA